VPPTFFYDFNSPYAYLAAARIDDVLPGARWQPVAFGFILRHSGRIPWSFAADTSTDRAEIARRAAERGLPPVRYPEGWPVQSYSLLPLRAALVADEQDRLREFSHAAFAHFFADGRSLQTPEAVAEVAAATGVDLGRLEHPEIKARLKDVTDDAIARGVEGVPTVDVGGRLFWGDDRLEDAKAALSAR
jgi:2-hydroxychromene-2-carboxylate isomerase